MTLTFKQTLKPILKNKAIFTTSYIYLTIKKTYDVEQTKLLIIFYTLYFINNFHYYNFIQQTNEERY